MSNKYIFKEKILNKEDFEREHKFGLTYRNYCSIKKNELAIMFSNKVIKEFLDSDKDTITLSLRKKEFERDGYKFIEIVSNELDTQIVNVKLPSNEQMKDNSLFSKLKSYAKKRRKLFWF